jgi:hypothetical protein
MITRARRTLGRFRNLLSISYLDMDRNPRPIMKRPTGVTVVLAGIGAVGGIFGMSQATPAVAGQEGFGFYSITVITIVVAGIAVAILR